MEWKYYIWQSIKALNGFVSVRFSCLTSISIKISVLFPTESKRNNVYALVVAYLFNWFRRARPKTKADEFRAEKGMRSQFAFFSAKMRKSVVRSIWYVNVRHINWTIELKKWLWGLCNMVNVVRFGCYLAGGNDRWFWCHRCIMCCAQLEIIESEERQNDGTAGDSTRNP